MDKESKKQAVDFGFQQIPAEQKSKRVAEVFHSVAPHYDIMNDLMSLGLHRIWKRFTLSHLDLLPHHHILDIASGTGDLALAMAPFINDQGKIILTDINESMLFTGRDRLVNAGKIKNIDYVVADGEFLPFRDNAFDRITLAFGLRNMTHKDAALRSIYRTLKPGGKILILEFSHPENSILNKIYDFYSFNIIPKIGELVAKNRASYQYLVESIRMHPNQETLKSMMLSAQFEDVIYHNLSGGIVALHIGYKY